MPFQSNLPVVAEKCRRQPLSNAQMAFSTWRKSPAFTEQIATEPPAREENVWLGIGLDDHTMEL